MPTAAAVRRFNHYARAIQEIHITWQDGQRFLSAPWSQARAAMDAPDTRPLLWRLTRIHFDGLPGPAIRTVLPLVPRAVTYSACCFSILHHFFAPVHLVIAALSSLQAGKGARRDRLLMRIPVDRRVLSHARPSVACLMHVIEET